MSPKNPACFYPPASLLKKMRIDDKDHEECGKGFVVRKRKRPPMATSEIDTPTQKR